MMRPAYRAFRFGPFEVDTRSGELRKYGIKIRLHNQPFRILLMLLEKPGEVVLRDEIRRSLWPADTNVEFDHGINAAVQRLRDALGDAADHPSYVETMPRRGYRFLAEVSEATPETASPAVAAPLQIAPDSAPLPQPEPRSFRTVTLVAALAAAVIGGGYGSWWILGKATGPQPLRFERLTFRPGSIERARFGPDGKTVIYAASWDGMPLDIFSIQPGGTLSRSLDMASTGLLAVSPSGELAVCARCALGWMNSMGTMAQVPASGGSARELRGDVQFADWTRDGKQMALGIGGDHPRLEYPAGRVLVAKSSPAWVGDPRISPDGKTVAFADHFYDGNDGAVAVVDREGNKRILTQVYDQLEGLAWSPNGREIWFTASQYGAFGRQLFAVGLTGGVRVVSRAPGNLTLQDVAADGRVLLTNDEAPSRVFLRGANDSPRDLTWLTFAFNPIVSSDGQTLLMTENDEATGNKNMVYLRSADGAPAVRLAEGSAVGLSPDGHWVVANNLPEVPLRFSLIPVKSGERVPMDTGSLLLTGGELSGYTAVSWMPDSKSVVFAANEPGRAPRTFAWEVAGGTLTPVTPEGLWGTLLAPDGKYLLVRDSQSTAFLYPMRGGKQIPLPLPARFEALAFSQDGRALYVCDVQERPFRIRRMDLKTGAITIWREVDLEPVAFVIRRPQITPDGKWLAYEVRKRRSELYVVTGVR